MFRLTLSLNPTFIFIVSIIFAQSTFSAVIGSGNYNFNGTYDYIIVGGGLSGLVVANRLTEDSNKTVLVLEAGPFSKNESFITVPLISTCNIRSLECGAQGTIYDYNLTSTPQTSLSTTQSANRTITLPQGKVVGGGTVLNGMVYVRGSQRDYDHWEELGNPGWGWEGMLPYFKKSENFTMPDATEEAVWGVEYDIASRGEGGHVQTGFPRFVWPSTVNFLSAFKELDVPILNNAYGGNSVGAYWYTLSLDSKNQERSTSQGFYDPKRTNLHLLTGAKVTKLLFNNNSSRVIGVEYAIDESEKKYKVFSALETILAAGALHTPQILQLSGIGDERHLSSLGIKTVVDLPGVGANHQDHVLAVTVQSVNVEVQTGNFTNETWVAEQLELYDEKREGKSESSWHFTKLTSSGPFTTVGGNAFSFLPLAWLGSSITSLFNSASSQSPSEYLPISTHPTILAGYILQHRLLTADIPSTATAHFEIIISDTAIIPVHQHPFSRGFVQINSTSAFDPPLIDLRYLSNPLDLAAFAIGFNYTRLLRQAPSLQAIAINETYPGSIVSTPEEIDEWIRGSVSSIHHHSGTAAMMPRELGGVVDPELRVYGIQGLRVVDASIIPMLAATHIQGDVYGIAEKAGALIRDYYA